MTKSWCIFLLSFTSAVAELSWSNTTVTIRPAGEVEYVEAEFPFRNVGSTDITIAEIHTSCGCTAAQPDKVNYAAGERGTIRARFDTRGRYGHQQKTISVTVAGPPPTTVNLQLIVELPAPYTVAPRLLRWPVGSSPNPQSIRYVRHPQFTQPLPDAPSEVPGFTIETISIGKHAVEFKVTPKSTTARAKVRLPLQILTGGYDGSGSPAQQRISIVLSIE